MVEILFKVIFTLLLFFYIVIRVPFDKIYKQEEKIKTYYTPIEKFVLALMSIGLLVFPLLWAFTPWLHIFKMNFPVWLRLTGVVISLLSLIYFRWVHKSLGANWSPTLEIRKEHRIVKTGPYKKIRHPMYVQVFLWSIAQILIISNLLAGFSGLLTFIVFYFLRVPKEEKMMKDNFGNEYIEYMKQTGRIFPKIK